MDKHNIENTVLKCIWRQNDTHGISSVNSVKEEKWRDVILEVKSRASSPPPLILAVTSNDEGSAIIN